MDVGNYAFITEERRRPSRKRKILYACIIILILFTFITLLVWLINCKSFGRGGSKPQDYCTLIPDNEKFNCHPDLGINEEECLKRGCCYQAASDLFVKDIDLINSRYFGIPSCFYPTDFKGYEIVNISERKDGINATMERQRPSGFPTDIRKVLLNITFIDDASLRIRLTDANSVRFEPEVALHYKTVENRKKLYSVELESDGLLTVTRNKSGTVVFRTKLSQVVFSDQFLQLTTDTSSTFLYGLGEQKEGFLKMFNWTRLTLFNQGDLPVPNRNLYGSHPFYLVMEPDGNSNGVFLLNSNAMDAILQPAPAVTFRPIGGIFDFFIMLGPTPADVVRQYTGIVGRPSMIPYWALGFQICKYGYFTLNKTKEILQRNLAAGIPVDVQWHDIDFMNRHLDFTYDPVKFKGLPEWVDELHASGRYYVAMISPGVSNTEKTGTYAPYDDGAAQDLFIKDVSGKYIEAKVWNDNYTVFPDFSNPATPAYWMKQFSDYHSVLKFDGVWIDMNEPLNFMNGTVNGCPSLSLDDPPYVPGRPYSLKTLTICMSAKHNKTTHYNEHNLMGFREAAATYNAMKDIRQKRPFIISRASFSGQGTYSGHWSGDITSDWEDMRYTIPSTMTFNMYGMPMIGSDICGFRQNTTEELCARWQALGAFYPFSRNHNDYDTIEQDPAAWGPNSPVLKSSIDNLYTRYYLLPYFYTLFHRSHVYGETTVRPLLFEFPNDKNVYDIDEEFLWGPALLIMPALYPHVDEIHPYIPKGLWYDFYTGKRIVSEGEKKVLSANLTFINVAVRAGYVLPLQLPGNTTTASRRNHFDLLVALDEEQTASGELFWDDGDSLDTFENKNYNQINFSAAKDTFKSTVSESGYNSAMHLNEIKFYGVSRKPLNVTINEDPASFEFKETYLSVKANTSLLLNLTIEWS